MSDSMSYRDICVNECLIVCLTEISVSMNVW